MSSVKCQVSLTVTIMKLIIKCFLFFFTLLSIHFAFTFDQQHIFVSYQNLVSVYFSNKEKQLELVYSVLHYTCMEMYKTSERNLSSSVV